MTRAPHFQITPAKIKAVPEVPVSGQHIPVYVWRGETSLESPVVKVHVQRWALCCVWSEHSTLKRGEAAIDQDEGSGALPALHEIPAGKMWPVLQSFPWRVLGSCTPAYLWKAEQFPIVRDVKHFPDKHFPLPWRKTIKPQQSCWFLLALSSAKGYSSYPCQSH